MKFGLPVALHAGRLFREAVYMKELWNDGWEFSKLHLEDDACRKDGKPLLLSPEAFHGRAPDSFAPVEVPHDWLIYDTSALYENSVGFYRKRFPLAPAEDSHFFLRFEGIYMNWAAYVNGLLACVWKYGYQVVEFDITPFVHGGTNTVEVIAVYQNPNTRWYSGAGIFRDVYLVTTGAARISPDGIYFTAKKLPSPQEAAGVQQGAAPENRTRWQLDISTEISGAAEGLSVRHTLSCGGTELVLSDVEQDRAAVENPAPQTGIVPQEKTVLLHRFRAAAENPLVWDVSAPNVYVLRTELLSGGRVVDFVEQQVGFRTVHFDPDRGLFLNGRPLKLHGVCEHHDFGSLGAAFNLCALRRKFLKLRNMGVNSFRTSHNPQAPAFLDLADRMGFLIDDEFFDMWEKSKTAYDYGNYFAEWHERDCAAQTRRDRNHPCLLMWSIGNEIYDTHQGNGLAITRGLKAIVRRHDPERNGLVTIGSNYMDGEGAQRCAEELDLVGYNYAERLYEAHHRGHPGWCVYGSETSSTVQSRGIYHFPYANRLLTHADLQCSSLGNCSTNWGARCSEDVVTKDRDASFCAGQYLWTGFDYIGEPTPYFTKNSYFGQLDTAGFEKDTFYAYKAGWVAAEQEAFVHLFPYWDFNEGQLIDVRAFTNAAAVELFVNGVSAGKKHIDVRAGADFSAVWERVPYAPGEIRAVACRADGTVLAEDVQRSFGDSAALVAEVEPYSADGLYFVDISSVDRDGVPVANSRSAVQIEVCGAAELVSADNGDSTDYAPYRCTGGRQLTRRLFSNRLLAIVRGQGIAADFSVRLTSPGLRGTELVFRGGVPDGAARELPAAAAADGGCVPVRKITLSCSGERRLSPSCRELTVTAAVHPAGAGFPTLDWAPMMLEGIRSDCAEIVPDPQSGGRRVLVRAVNDGEFRLVCSAANGASQPQVLSELEFSVSGLGHTAVNPYALVEACRCSASSRPVSLSFTGGVECKDGVRQWFRFDRIDFGADGSGTVTLPLFVWSEHVPFELWDGSPDDGTLLLSAVYSRPWTYNVYTPQDFTLPRRLYGMHSLSFVFSQRLSFQGFCFAQEKKAFARLSALDANTITGDSFERTQDAVTGIGNNVTLEFTGMDFGGQAAAQLTVCGWSHVHNTIRVTFSTDSGDVNRSIEFGQTEGYEERTFPLAGVSGRATVSFIFLPGSSFDFRWFRFS